MLFNPTGYGSNRTQAKGLTIDQIGRMRMVWVWFEYDPVALQTDRHKGKIGLFHTISLYVCIGYNIIIRLMFNG